MLTLCVPSPCGFICRNECVARRVCFGADLGTRRTFDYIHLGNKTFKSLRETLAHAGERCIVFVG